MSHIVSIATRIKDAGALAAACQRLGLPPPKEGTARLFSTTATGQLVQLPGWTYPVVIDTASGEVRFDNYAGRWGTQRELDKLLQAYAVEASEQSERLFVPHFVTLDTRSLATTSTAVDANGDQNTNLNDFLDFWSREAATTSTNMVRLLVCRERSNSTLPVWRVLEQVLLKQGTDGENNSLPISVAFLIGPEGGWSPQENERMDALEREYPELFWNVSLGPNILRAETAAMTAVAAFTLFQDAQQ